MEREIGSNKYLLSPARSAHTITAEIALQTPPSSLSTAHGGACGDLCAVCLSPLTRLNTEPIVETSCRHAFHSGCLNEAKRTMPRCPVCRQQLTPINPPNQQGINDSSPPPIALNYPAAEGLGIVPARSLESDIAGVALSPQHQHQLQLLQHAHPHVFSRAAAVAAAAAAAVEDSSEDLPPLYPNSTVPRSDISGASRRARAVMRAHQQELQLQRQQQQQTSTSSVGLGGGDVDSYSLSPTNLMNRF